MAVTDNTSALPWWVTGAASPPVGAGPTPPGTGGTSWLNYLASMFAPSAQGATLTPSQQLQGLLAARANGQPQTQPGNIPIGPNTIQPPQSQPNQGGGYPPPGPMAANGPPPQPPYNPLSGGSANTGLPAAPGASANPATGAPPVNPNATGGQNLNGVTANAGRFIPIQYNVPGSGPGRNAPIYTALNLGGAQNPLAAAAPPGAQATRGPLASGGMSRAPWGMGPTQRGMTFPNRMGPFTPDQIAAASLRQRYG